MCVVCFPGVLKESKQWEVYTEGPANGPHAEGPQVSSTSSGEWEADFKSQCQTLCHEKPFQRKPQLSIFRQSPGLDASSDIFRRL